MPLPKRQSILLPWAWLPVFGLLALSTSLTELLDVELAPLAVPLAAWLGHAHGRKGMVVVLLGGIFLVPTVDFGNYTIMGGWFDVWVLSVITCWIVQRRPDRVDWEAMMARWSPRIGFLVLLPVFIGLWGHRFDPVLDFDDFSVSLTLSLGYVLFAACFGAGVAGVAFARFSFLFLLMVILGQVIPVFHADELLNAQLADIPLLGIVELESVSFSYAFRDGYTIVCAALWFMAGRLARHPLLATNAPGRWTSLTLLSVLVVVAAGLIPLSYITSGLSEINDLIAGLLAKPAAIGPPSTIPMTTLDTESLAMEAVRVTGTTIRYPVSVLFPLLGFLSALIYAWRGVLGSIAALFLVWIFESAIDGNFPHLAFPTSLLLVLLGYGAAGIALRNAVTGENRRWWSWGWIIYLTLAALYLLPLLGERFWSIYTPTIIGAAVVLGLSMERLLRWLQAQSRHPHGGWIALLTLGSLVCLLWGHLAALGESLFMLVGAATFAPMIEEFENSWIIGIVALAVLWVALKALSVFVHRIPDLVADVKQAAALIAAALRQQPSPQPPELEIGTAPKPWWHPQQLLDGASLVVKWVSIGIVLTSVARPSWEALREFQQDRAEHIAEQTSLGETAHPDLIRSAKEVFKAWGLRFEEPSWNGGRYRTSWFVDTTDPDVRQRAEVLLSTSLEDDPVTVYVELQHRRLGIWVKVDGDWSLEQGTGSDLEARIATLAKKHAVETTNGLP